MLALASAGQATSGARFPITTIGAHHGRRPLFLRECGETLHIVGLESAHCGLRSSWSSKGRQSFHPSGASSEIAVSIARSRDLSQSSTHTVHNAHVCGSNGCHSYGITTHPWGSSGKGSLRAYPTASKGGSSKTCWKPWYQPHRVHISCRPRADELRLPENGHPLWVTHVGQRIQPSG